MVQTLFPVVISGGAGTRLWPLSTQEKPKQFHALATAATMIQDTVVRLTGIDGVKSHEPILISNQAHLRALEEQLAAAGCVPSAFVLEPFGRNTAPVAMAAALLAEAEDPDALVLLMPSDHVIGRPEAFRAAVRRAAPMAKERIVLFGVTPTSPETGYGYIEAGEPLRDDLATVVRFVEKPDRATAQAYLANGRYLWNAGLFLFAPHVLIQEMERWAPQVAQTTRAAFVKASRTGRVLQLDPEAFGHCPSISLDYAVMEHTDRSAVTPIDVDWADIGSWNSLWSQGPRDGSGNFVHGDAEVMDSEGCLVWSESGTVAVMGVRDLVVVQTTDGTLVLPRSRAEDVKLLVERLKTRDAGSGGQKA